LRTLALTTLTNVSIGNLDPLSDPGTQDGYGEVYLIDQLGTRPPNTSTERTNGWDRQLLVQVQITPFASGHLVVLGSSDAPLTTQTPVADFLDTIIPGTDVFVDGYGNVFEIDHTALPYVWLKKPSASDVELPLGVITAFRKVAGVSLPDSTFISIPIDWSEPSTCTMQKRNGAITLLTNQIEVSSSYVLHHLNNSVSSGISFGQFDLNADSVVRIQSINYNIYPIFTTDEVYIGNTGNHPTTDSISFKYDTATTGIPAINSDIYFAVFTNKSSAGINEPVDEVFVKMKIPSTWELSDGTNTAEFDITPTIKFSTQTTGDLIDIVDAYGMTYSQTQNNDVRLTAIDTATYVSGHSSILLDGGPELRISAGKRHYLFDVETPEGAMRLYRSGSGHLTAETQIANAAIYNIRSDISNWIAGQLHHIAMSWKISSPDETDELHLFIDGDEVPNEITFGSGSKDGYIGQVYAEIVTPLMRTASPDGYIINDVNGSGLFIPSDAAVQPDSTWIDKTIVLGGGVNVFLNEPLIVGSIIMVAGGSMLFLSQNSIQIDFSIYGPSTPILYGLATSVIADSTILVRTNFGVFKNGAELDGPASSNPQFRQVGDTQIVEIYDTDPTSGEYIENVSDADTITIQTYGLLTQRIKQSVYQYGSLIRSNPVIVNTLQSNVLVVDNATINDGGPAFITSLPPPVDPTQVSATKILLPRVTL
jgi:hypothetical protein